MSKFEKYDRILCRSLKKNAGWEVHLFDSYTDNTTYCYRTVDNQVFASALPFEGNEELIGTSYDSLDDLYNATTYHFGDVVGLHLKGEDESYKGIYIAKAGKGKNKHLVALEPRLCEVKGIPLNQAIRAINNDEITKE